MVLHSGVEWELTEMGSLEAFAQSVYATRNEPFGECVSNIVSIGCFGSEG